MPLENLVENRKQNLKKLIESKVDPYPYSFDKNASSTEIKKHAEKLKDGEALEKLILSGAGRIVSKRSFGKLTFLDILNGDGKFQAVISESTVGKKGFESLSYVDVGDFIGVKGKPYKTKRGEPSLLINEFTFLSKALLPLPEKWHGLKDVETRYRQRYLDLISNYETRNIFKTRARIISLVRKFLDSRGYLETEIPLLQPTYGGANARPFLTKSHAWKSDFYLSISPELYLKRLIVGGFEKVYTICKNFRNEDVDRTHNPEFTMMECYAAYHDYNDMMKLTEELYEMIAKELFGTTKFTYQGIEIDVKTPWKRMTMIDALKKFANLDVTKLSDADLKKLLKENQLEVNPYKRGLAIADLFGHLCEKHLIQPIFITDHPKETTPLCKQKRGNPDLIERFEPYINATEIGNAYSELNDAEHQEKLFREQADQGVAKGENHPIDMDFVETMKYGMPPTGGLGLGIDRMVMFFTDSPTIKDVILFPQMRPERDQHAEKKE